MEPTYTVYDVAEAGGIQVKTVHRWSRKGLLPPAVSRRTDGFNYTTEHIQRARRLRAYFDSRLTVAELAERLRTMGDAALDVPDGVDPYLAPWDDDEEGEFDAF